MMNLAIQGKHTPERWKTVYNLYLLKEAGIYRRHQLRMLHIIDVELNLTRQELITRRLMNMLNCLSICQEINTEEERDMWH
eukprot:5583774-Ditylum_brightwellii.AAC.1